MQTRISILSDFRHINIFHWITLLLFQHEKVGFMHITLEIEFFDVEHYVKNKKAGQNNKCNIIKYFRFCAGLKAA